MSSTAHPSLLALERMSAGKLCSNEQSDLEAHLVTCSQCEGRWQELCAAQRHFMAEVYPRTIATTLERCRSSERAKKSSPWRWAAVPVLAVAVIVLFVTVRPRPAPLSPSQSEALIATKGSTPTFGMFARRGSEVFRVRSGSVLAPGDQVRFVVGPGNFNYLLIASIDGAGVTSIYYPFDGKRSAPLTREPRQELPGSVVLDQTLGSERVYALFSREPLSAKQVSIELLRVGREHSNTLRRHRDLRVRAKAQESIWFEKREP